MTVVLPSRNGAPRLEAAVKSVLGQTFPDFECLILNDGSTDGTAELAERLARTDSRIRVIHSPRPRGLQTTLNTGLAHASGEFISRIDDDDLWILPAKLGLQLDAFRRDPALLLVGTGARIQDPVAGREYLRALPLSDVEIRSRILAWNPFVHSSVMFRREAAARAGGYDETLRHSEDHDLWLKLGRHGNFANLPEVCVEYHLSTSVASFSKRLRSASEQLLLLRRHGGDYPGAARAGLAAVGRFALHLLPIGHGARSRLRARRRR